MSWVCCSGPICTDSFRKPLNAAVLQQYQWWNSQATLAVAFSNLIYLWSCPFFEQQARLPQEVPSKLHYLLVLWKFSNTPSVFPIHRLLWEATGIDTKAVVVCSAPMLGGPMAVRCVVGWLCPMVRKQAPNRDRMLPCVWGEQERANLVQSTAERQR